MSPRTLQFVNPKKEECEERIHFVNFKSAKDCEGIKTEEYFESQFKFDNNTGKNLHVSFRGRPMNGREYELPGDYQMSVMKKSDNDNAIRLENAGKKLMAWNLDKACSTADSLPQFNQWLDICDSVHSHVQIDD